MIQVPQTDILTEDHSVDDIDGTTFSAAKRVQNKFFNSARKNFAGDKQLSLTIQSDPFLLARVLCENQCISIDVDELIKIKGVGKLSTLTVSYMLEINSQPEAFLAGFSTDMWIQVQQMLQKRSVVFAITAKRMCNILSVSQSVAAQVYTQCLVDNASLFFFFHPSLRYSILQDSHINKETIERILQEMVLEKQYSIRDSYSLTDRTQLRHDLSLFWKNDIRNHCESGLVQELFNCVSNLISASESGLSQRKVITDYLFPRHLKTIGSGELSLVVSPW